MTIKSLGLTRRRIQIALGCLWLLDGALQLQHQMFTSNFANQVITPASIGQPKFISGLIHLATRIFLLHPAIFNSLVALIQLGLGVLILLKRTARLGLISSVFWGLFVWYIGEGLGNIFTGHTLILMGAPGAALLYVILALCVLPPKDNKNQRSIRHASYWLAPIWAVLWVGGAIYQLLPGQNSVSALSSMVSASADSAPGWLASIDNHIGGWINGLGTPATSMANVHMTASQMAQMQTQPGTGYWFILLLAFVQLFIGLAIFLPKLIRKFSIYLAILVLLIFWVIGQSLGGYYTGLATDPNSAPLLILMGLSILSMSELDKWIINSFNRIESTIT